MSDRLREAIQAAIAELREEETIEAALAEDSRAKSNDDAIRAPGGPASKFTAEP